MSDTYRNTIGASGSFVIATPVTLSAIVARCSTPLCSYPQINTSSWSWERNYEPLWSSSVCSFCTFTTNSNSYSKEGKFRFAGRTFPVGFAVAGTKAVEGAVVVAVAVAGSVLFFAAAVAVVFRGTLKGLSRLTGSTELDISLSLLKTRIVTDRPSFNIFFQFNNLNAMTPWLWLWLWLCQLFLVAFPLRLRRRSFLTFSCFLVFINLIFFWKFEKNDYENGWGNLINRISNESSWKAQQNPNTRSLIPFASISIQRVLFLSLFLSPSRSFCNNLRSFVNVQKRPWIPLLLYKWLLKFYKGLKGSFLIKNKNRYNRWTYVLCQTVCSSIKISAQFSRRTQSVILDERVVSLVRAIGIQFAP